MKRTALALITVLLAALAAGAAAQQPPPDEADGLRARLERRFDIVPLTNGIGLRPKTAGDVRLVEVSDGTILVNGDPVTGRELRERLGADADAVLRLSYLGAAERRALLEGGSATRPAAAPQASAEPPLERPAPVEPLPPPQPPEPPSPERPRERRSATAGERVRIFGDVAVEENEVLRGQAVAVLGSVRVDGEVGDQVVAVLGSVRLGPKAVVHGDVVSVGGRVHRADGAQIRGSVTEVSFADAGFAPGYHPGWGAGPWHRFNGFGSVPRLIGTALRLLLLVLLVSIAVVVARPTVESSAERVAGNPVQSTFVGLAAEVLLIPAIILTAIVLAISIVGIPLLVLLPFVLLFLLLLALAGFSGVAVAVGRWTRRKMGFANPPAIVDILLGVLVILLPVLIGRLVALGGWPGAPVAVIFVVIGFTVEFLAWACGFGAVLSNAATRWQARRAARMTPPGATA